MLGLTHNGSGDCGWGDVVVGGLEEGVEEEGSDIAAASLFGFKKGP